MTIEEELRQLQEECPMLIDESFLTDYPGVDNVVGFLHSSSKFHKTRGIPFKPYEAVGVEETRGFVEQITNNNPEAIWIYRSIKDTFGF